MLVHYWADRFCIARIWAPMPSVGAKIGQFHRTTVTPILLIILAVMNAYLWSGFPYDSLCGTFLLLFGHLPSLLVHPFPYTFSCSMRTHSSLISLLFSSTHFCVH